MGAAEIALVAAVVLSAIAILPGSLGVFMFTNRVAATPAGARAIYLYSPLLLIAALGLLTWGVFSTGLTPFSVAAVALLAGICVFGFLMHAGLMFQPLREPTFMPVDEALELFGEDEEVVGVLDSAGTPYAFVARYLQ